MTVRWGDAYRLELENVGGAIRRAALLPLGRDDAVCQARTIDALYRSAEASAAVTVGDWSSA